jgi:choline-sulfatase
VGGSPACRVTESERGDAALPGNTPPVILVIVDTLRADRLGLHGYGRNTSPLLDRLAEEMVVFENAYSQAPNTPPSVASILTSLYPSSHHFTGNGDRIPEAALTLAEMLHAAGYRTGAFVDAGFLRERFGMSQGFEIYDDEGGGLDAMLPRVRLWLDAEQDRPFFLLLHTYDVHVPYEKTPEPYRNAFVEHRYTGELESRQLEEIRMGRLKHSLTPEETRHFSDLYDGGILHMDAVLGKFLEELRERKILDRAVVVISSDHGEEFMEHGSVLHDKLYRTVTHVPLLLRLPEGEAAGLRRTDVVETIDIAPTVLDAVGVPAHTGMQGESLLRLIRGANSSFEGAVGELTWDPHTTGFYAGRYHLMSNPQVGRIELYDVGSDPMEQRNLADSNEQQVVLLQDKLRVRLENAAARGYLLSTDTTAEELDEESKQSLRELGYLQ